jgi:hypothetical protein
VRKISYQAPAIETQPVGAVVSEGQSATFTVTASGVSLSYQWQHLVGSAWSNVGTDSPAYTIPTATTADAGEYRVIVSSSGASVVSDAVTLTVNVGATPNLAPGLEAEFFDFRRRLRARPRLAGRAADVTRIDPVIDYGATRHPWPGLDARFAGTFAVRETGVVEISTPGRYTFTLRSKDGSRLWLDGVRLVNNGGIHPMRSRARSVTLTPGVHTLRVESFAAARGSGLILSWSGPGLSRQVIPADHLFHATGTAGLPSA